MTSDLLEALAATEVPPVPADFDHGVHERLNKVLFAGHVAELGLKTLPYALANFAQAVLGLVMFTLSGRYPAESSVDHP